MSLLLRRHARAASFCASVMPDLLGKLGKLPPEEPLERLDPLELLDPLDALDTLDTLDPELPELPDDLLSRPRLLASATDSVVSDGAR